MKHHSPSPATPSAAPSSLGRLIAFSAAGAYFAVLFVGGLLHGSKMSVLAPDFIAYLNPLVYTVAFLAVGGILCLYGSISRAFVYRFAWIAAVAYALRTVVSGGSYPLTFLMCGVVALMTALCGWALHTEPSEKKIKKPVPRADGTGRISAGAILTAAVAVAVGGFALFLVLSTYLSYMNSPVMSTGMYVQLLESLRNGFSFDTTLEFGETVSHFAAHVSPVFLIFLPFYAVLPSPVTLLVLEVLAVYSSVIPLWLLARRRGLSQTVAAVLCGLLCLYPPVLGGTIGGFHEYALLLPLLLWLMWAFASGRRVLVWVFAALSLCVRETAAIHVFTLAVYRMIVNRKSLDAEGDPAYRRAARKQALILALVSAVYFVAALFALSTFGRGILITRFDNVTGEYGFFVDSFLREIFCNPALILYELYSEAKMFYVLLLLLPLCFLPFRSRRAGLVFLFPVLFLNLLADYAYHYNTDFPYGFGTAALLFYLAIEGLAALRAREDHGRSLKRYLWLAVSFTLIIGAQKVAEYLPYMEYAVTEQAEVEAMDRLLDTVDPDASVSVSARLCPNVAARTEVYTLSQKVETDVVVLDLREDWALSAEETFTVAFYEKSGYRVAAIEEGVGAVLVRASDSGT